MKVTIQAETRYTVDLGVVRVVECERRNGPAPGLVVYVGRLNAGRRPKVWLVMLEGSSLQAVAPLLGMDGSSTLIAAPREVLDWIEAPKLDPLKFSIPLGAADEFSAFVREGLNRGKPLHVIKAELNRLAEDPGLHMDPVYEGARNLAHRLLEIRGAAADTSVGARRDQAKDEPALEGAPDDFPDEELEALGVPRQAFSSARSLATHLADGGANREGITRRIQSIAREPELCVQSRGPLQFEGNLARKIINHRGDS